MYLDKQGLSFSLIIEKGKYYIFTLQNIWKWYILPFNKNYSNNCLYNNTFRFMLHGRNENINRILVWESDKLNRKGVCIFNQHIIDHRWI